jgi:proton-translocating NAD(P)+ transhydrogenase subunit alpha
VSPLLLLPLAASPEVDPVAGLVIFVLAAFVGFEVITKVPTTLHTPLMSGANAISGIILMGAILVAGMSQSTVGTILGVVGVFLATVNVVGGFLVTGRMLKMFKRPKAKKGSEGKAS